MAKFKMGKKLKKRFIRIIVALSLFLVVFILDRIFILATVIDGKFSWLFPFALYLGIYVLIGYDVIFKAVRNILHGQVFDENFLMCVATLGAFAIAIYRGVMGLTIEGFDEACAVLLFYQVGEFFQAYATGKSRKSISSLMDIRPDYANLVADNEPIIVSPDQVKVGDIILVNPGEKVPLDGVIIKGQSTLDVKALTGESLPKDVFENDQILSGAVNITSQLYIKVTKAFYDSTVSKILDLVENASSQKSRSENFITKFSKIYTPTVCVTALLLAVIPSLITGDWQTWIYRALSFLVVSCPCALVISIPLSFFAGLGASSRYGILVKGSNYLEKFSKANIFYFDKTGTLTKGNFAVSSVYPENKREEILQLASIAENYSNHPIARSIIAEYGKEIEEGFTLTNEAGLGVVATKLDTQILCGNEKLMEKYGIDFTAQNSLGTIVYVAKNGEFVGSLVIVDQVKPEAKEVIGELEGLKAQTFMLTGDNEKIASGVAKELNLTGFKASLLPQNKVDELENALSNKGDGDVLCFVGDGINDVPSLMRADIGIAMGGVGSDAAIEAADVVLMQDNLKGIPLAKKIAKKTMAIVRQNIVFSIAIKIGILILSAFGIANMWLAVFGDVGVAVLAILNAMRVNSKY